MKDDAEALAFMKAAQFRSTCRRADAGRSRTQRTFNRTATIHDLTPTQLAVEAEMSSDGIVVISDAWDSAGKS